MGLRLSLGLTGGGQQAYPNLFLPVAWLTQNLAASTWTPNGQAGGTFVSDGTSGTSAYKAIQVVPGNTYNMTVTAQGGGTQTALIRAGSSIGTSQYVSQAITSGMVSTNLSFDFVPTSTPVYVTFGLGSAGAAVTFSKVVVRERKTYPGIYAWGDSITAFDSGATAYPAKLAALFTPARTVLNKGVGSETSTQIKTRALAQANVLRNTHVIEAGRNNFADPTTVKADIAAMIAYLGGSYLVLSILPSSGDTAPNLAALQALNIDLAALYGSRFVDLLTPLQAGNDGSANDLADVAAGLTPRSLRDDALHPNEAGRTILAATVRGALPQPNVITLF